MKDIIKRLNTNVIISYLLILLVFCFIFFFRDAESDLATRINSTVILVATAFFSIAFPILFRTYFYQKGMKDKILSKKNYLLMKNLIIISITIGAIISIIGYFIPIYKYHMYLSILAGIWGVYSIFPSKVVVKKEVKEFYVDKED